MQGNTATAQQLGHVIFPLAVDEDGWPPVSGERVWAQPLGGDRYRLCNTPFFARGVAEDDVVRATAPNDAEWPEYQETLVWSGNCTIRVIPFRAGSLNGSQQAVLDLFLPLGATGERAGIYPIVALTIRPDLDLRAVKTLLEAGEADGRWSYEEGCIGDEWAAA